MQLVLDCLRTNYEETFSDGPHPMIQVVTALHNNYFERKEIDLGTESHSHCHGHSM